MKRAFHAVAAANNAARSYEHVEVTPLAGSLGAEIGGVNLRALVRALDGSRSGGSADAAAMAEIRRASDDHLVVFFRDQNLTAREFEAFARCWGEPGEDPFLTGMDGHPAVVRLLKEADEALPVVFGGAWHSDWSFLANPPAYTMLHALAVPDHGGDTMWANMYLVTEWLSERWLGVLRGLDAVHSARAAYGPGARHNEFIENMEISYGDEGDVSSVHPVVRVHPRTGREAVYANPVYTTGLAGLRPEESAPVLKQIWEAAVDPVHTCRFRWRPGSLAVWDNRCTMHLPLSDYHGARREMWRTTVRGEAPVRGSRSSG